MPVIDSVKSIHHYANESPRGKTTGYLNQLRVRVESAIYNHMTKQCRKLLPTHAALDNGLDAISRKKAPEQNACPNCLHLNK
jgi:hypothetical protein